MELSRSTRAFVSSLVDSYSRYNISIKQNDLTVDDIPEYDLCKLSAMLLADNDDYCSESLGPDNQLFESCLIPTIQSYLRNIHDQDEAIKLAECIRKIIIAHHEKVIESLIQDELQDYNAERPFDEDRDGEALTWRI